MEVYGKHPNNAKLTSEQVRKTLFITSALEDVYKHVHDVECPDIQLTHVS